MGCRLRSLLHPALWQGPHEVLRPQYTTPPDYRRSGQRCVGRPPRATQKTGACRFLVCYYDAIELALAPLSLAPSTIPRVDDNSSRWYRQNRAVESWVTRWLGPDMTRQPRSREWIRYRTELRIQERTGQRLREVVSECRFVASMDNSATEEGLAGELTEDAGVSRNVRRDALYVDISACRNWGNGDCWSAEVGSITKGVLGVLTWLQTTPERSSESAFRLRSLQTGLMRLCRQLGWGSGRDR